MAEDQAAGCLGKIVFVKVSGGIPPIFLTLLEGLDEIVHILVLENTVGGWAILDIATLGLIEGQSIGTQHGEYGDGMKCRNKKVADHNGFF